MKKLIAVILLIASSALAIDDITYGVGGDKWSNAVVKINATKDLAESNANRVTVIEDYIIDVTQAPYNAIGDGTNDCTAALQAAFDEQNANGGRVYIPQGTYIITSELTNAPTTEATVIYGDGATLTTLRQVTVGESVLRFVNTATLYGGIEVTGITFDGAGITGNLGTTNETYGLRIDDTLPGGNSINQSRNRIIGCSFFENDVGLSLDTVDQTLIEQCIARDNDLGFETDGNCNAVTYIATAAKRNEVGQFYLGGNTGIGMIGCEVGNSQGQPATYMVQNAARRAYMIGCNLEIWEDIPYIILNTNQYSSLLIESCYLNDLSDLGTIATYASVPIHTGAEYIGNTPAKLTINNFMYANQFTTNLVNRYSQWAEVKGDTGNDNPQGSVENASCMRTYSKWPAASSNLLFTGKIPLVPEWPLGVTTPTQFNHKLMYWNDGGTGKSDLTTVYRKAEGSFVQSSLINDVLLNTANTWPLAQTFTGNAVFSGAATINGTRLNIINDNYPAINTGNTTTTGLRIGEAGDYLGFYGVTPTAQPAPVANATDAASVITQLNTLLSRLRASGIIDE